MTKKILFFCLMTMSLAAQNIDNQLRLSAAVDYQFAKKWKVETQYRYGLDHDFGAFQSSVIQTGITYKLTKKWDIEAGYRFATAFDHDNHRLFASVKFEHKFKKQYSISARTRYQWTTQQFDADFMANFKAPSQYLRERIAFEYNVPKSKWSFNVGPEFFIRLDKSPIAYHRIRYYAGAKYDLKYGQAIGITYFFEDRYKATQDDRSVWNVNYSLSLDTFLKKLKKGKDKEKKAKKEKAD